LSSNSKSCGPAGTCRLAGWLLGRRASGANGSWNASLTDNGNEFKAGFDRLLSRRKIRHTGIRPGRPQTNGHVENLHKTILDECWRPSFARYHHIRYTGLEADLPEYLHIYNTDRTHSGRLTRGRIPTDILDPATR